MPISMYPKDMLFTSESVTEGHPDKLCDQISDAVLDECLRLDPQSRVACNTYATMGLILIGGEVTTKALFNVDELVRKLGSEIGYRSANDGFDVNASAILRSIHSQSPDIDLGVTKASDEIGAGDQGMMFGYACRQTKELMPLPIMQPNVSKARQALSSRLQLHFCLATCDAFRSSLFSRLRARTPFDPHRQPVRPIVWPEGAKKVAADGKPRTSGHAERQAVLRRARRRADPDAPGSLSGDTHWCGDRRGYPIHL